MPTITTNSPAVKYLAERDYRLRCLIDRVGDLEYMRPESAFQSLAHSIIEQMLSMKVGNRIEKRLQELCGGKVTASTLIKFEIEDIRACGISARKASYLQSLAEYALANDLEELERFTDSEVSMTLQQIPGIGKWTADMFLLFYLERPDVLPIEDGAVRQAFEVLYGVPITNPEVRKVICSLWSPYSSTAVRYLYRALNEGILRKGAAAKDSVDTAR